MTTPLTTPNAHAEIELDFTVFTAALTRIQLQLNTNARERARYAAEKSAITERAGEARNQLVELRAQLEHSQREKTHRLEYDAIAAGILSIKTLRARDEQYANIDRLNAEIRELERERDDYSHVWAARRGQFEEIVKQLEVMSAQIKEDKEEQDRREGMSEGEAEEEGEEGEVSASSGGGGSGGGGGGGAGSGSGGSGGKGGSSGGATPADGALALPGAAAVRGLTPNVAGGATPQPVNDEKEEGEEEEDEDVELVDAPPLSRAKIVGKGGGGGGDRMDTF